MREYRLAVEVPMINEEVVADEPTQGCVKASYEARPVPVMERAEPMTYEPAPQEAVPVQVMVPVATLAKVLAPLKYGMLPMTAAEDVESPLKPIVAPVRVIGQVVEMVFCLPLSDDCKSVPLSDRVPKYALVDEAYVEEKRVDEALVKFCSLLHVFESERSVVDAVLSVIVQERLVVRSYPVPLMVRVMAFEAGVNPKSDDEAAVVNTLLELM